MGSAGRPSKLNLLRLSRLSGMMLAVQQMKVKARVRRMRAEATTSCWNTQTELLSIVPRPMEIKITPFRSRSHQTRRQATARRVNNRRLCKTELDDGEDDEEQK